MSTAADPILKADPVFRNALRLGARSGSPIQIFPPRKKHGRGFLVALFGGLFGWAGFILLVGFLLSLRGV